MIKLRPYQNEAIEAIRDGFTKRFRQYIELPTGAGKTITFLSYAKQYHKSILIIVPSKQLLGQVYKSALNFYQPHEISRKGNRHDDSIEDVHICIINSIRGEYLDCLADWPFDLIIIDEAHHTQSDSYKRFISLKSEYFHEKDMKLLGVTATPDRSDGLLLQSILYDCTFKLSIEELINQKYLSDIEGFSVKTSLDLSDIDDHNGDFNINQLYKKLCIDSRNKMILKLCKEEMKDRKTIIFCINIMHSKIINKLLNENGLASSHIDGTMKEEQRATILESFREGNISYLCNCQLLTEGFDEPSIDGIILARPTRSRALFLQMIGRGLRLSSGKENCKVIDIVDNHRSLAGFNEILEECNFREIERFKTIKDIRDHITKELIKVTEFTIERVDLLNSRGICNHNALDCMNEYLIANNIQFFDPLSFDEASFLIWFHKLQQEYINGHRNKKTK